MQTALEGGTIEVEESRELRKVFVEEKRRIPV
jgi:hypothetical protein